MSNVERKPKASVSVLWMEAIFLEPGKNTGEVVRVSSVNGTNRIIIGGFDIHVPGEFGGDPNKVLAAYKRQIEQIDAAFANMPPDSKPLSYCEDTALIPISDDELDEQIREFDKQRKVICMKTGKTI